MACFAVLRRSYPPFKAPFFFYLYAAGLSLAIAAAFSSAAWPPAGALMDLGLASFGIILMAASRQLIASFRLAGEDYD